MDVIYIKSIFENECTNRQCYYDRITYINDNLDLIKYFSRGRCTDSIEPAAQTGVKNYSPTR
jgi:hypothetical protein